MRGGWVWVCMGVLCQGWGGEGSGGGIPWGSFFCMVSPARKHKSIALGRSPPL